jgi:hypothetical protein
MKFYNPCKKRLKIEPRIFFLIYRVAQKSFSRKHSLVLTRMPRFKLTVTLWRAVRTSLLVRSTWRIPFRTMFVNSVSNKEIYNVF